MNKKFISKSLFLLLGLLAYEFSFAGKINCPSVDVIKANINFIQAVDTKYVGWAFYSDTFNYDSKSWNLFYRVLMMQAKTKSDAINEARLKLANTVLTSEPYNVEISNGYTRCAYIGTESDRYLLLVTNPPYYGPVP